MTITMTITRRGDRGAPPLRARTTDDGEAGPSLLGGGWQPYFLAIDVEVCVTG